MPSFPTTRLAPLALASILCLASVVGAVPVRGHAASIECAKAATAVEQAICAERPLTRLDADVNREFSRLLQDYSLAAGSAGSPVVLALRQSQRVWLGERDACGADAACLGREYRRRLATFARRPDQATSPIDPYVGTFGDLNTDPTVTLGMMRGVGDEVLAMIDVVGIAASCRVVGIGRLDPGRHLTISVEPAPGREAALLVEAIPDGVLVRASVAAATACGRVNLAGEYPRQGLGKFGPVVPEGGRRFELQTDFGAMTLVIESDGRTVSGFYPDYRGQVVGTLSADGRSIAGDWFQPQGEAPCNQLNHGTAHWGRLLFTSPEKPQSGDLMTGYWSYCEARPTRQWNGRFDVVP